MKSYSQAAACAALVTLASPVLGQHAHSDLLIGSDVDGGGALLLEHSFDERPVVRVSENIVLPGLFDATKPGFSPAEDEPLESVYMLDLGTPIGIEITDIDSNVSLQMGMTSLSAIGDTAVIGTHDDSDPELSGLHTHPTYRVGLLADANTFGEGRFSFRLFDSGMSPAYGESPVYSVRVSNGFLAPLESLEDPMAADDQKKADLKCQKTVAGAVRKLHAKVYQLLGKCLDKVLAGEAGGTTSAALKACSLDGMDSNSIVSRVGTETQKAVDKLAGACGTLSQTSEPFTESAVRTHLGMASCRAQELAGATYNGSAEHWGEVLEAESSGDEDAVLAAFPCLTMSQGE